MRNIRQPHAVLKMIVGLVCVVMALLALAQDGASGTWDLTYRIPNGDSSASLSISRAEDGQLAGKWTSQYGTSTITEMKLEGGKLSFVRKLELRRGVFVSKFAGKIEGNRLTGALTSDEFGEQTVRGNRKEAR